MQLIIFLLIAAAAGVLMAIQGSMNGALGKIVGMLEGNFIVHAIALLAVVILLFVIGLGKGDLGKVDEVPWYLFLGGLINVAIIYGVMYAIGNIGAGAATTAIITGQLAMALIIDCLGLFGLQQMPMSWGKAIGLALMAVSARLILCK
ncbi:MAG: DMT family transporter [Clostridiales bacterium]